MFASIMFPTGNFKTFSTQSSKSVAAVFAAPIFAGTADKLPFGAFMNKRLDRENGPDAYAAFEANEIIMQHKHLQFGHGFRVVLGDDHSQAAQMTLAPGETEGGSDNQHKGADQWLYVVAGTGTAVLKGKSVPLREGTLILIQRGDNHEIKNSGSTPLRTLNIYVPPAYTSKGQELPAGQK